MTPIRKPLRPLLPLVLLSLAATGTAQAAIDLLAIGQIDAHGADRSTQTAAPLENGVAGNILGGLGSGLSYLGCDTFLGLPDRGPNATPYNSAIDETTSYIPRFQTLKMSLKPNAVGAPLPYSLSTTLTHTTLLSALLPLQYGANGKPALNAKTGRQYFSGRSDAFNPRQPSSNPSNGRFDPEGIRTSNSGGTVFITDEYGPYIYAFDRHSGARLWSYALPAGFYVSNLNAVGDTEINGNTSGRVANKGMEGLAISPDGLALFGIMQSPLIQDGGTAAAYTRIVRIELLTGRTQQYAYPLSNIGSASKPKYPTVSEILALNSHEFLVDERDGKGLGDNSDAVYKKIYRIDLAGAQDVSALSGEAALAPAAVSKTLFLDVVSALNAKGIASKDLPAKLEGLSFGPDVQTANGKRHTLFVSTDNDFLADLTDSKHPNGIANPNQMFVFGFADADLPGLVPQRLSPLACF